MNPVVDASSEQSAANAGPQRKPLPISSQGRRPKTQATSRTKLARQSSYKRSPSGKSGKQSFASTKSVDSTDEHVSQSERNRSFSPQSSVDTASSINAGKNVAEFSADNATPVKVSSSEDPGSSSQHSVSPHTSMLKENSSFSGQEFDLEELCRKRGLKRVLNVMQDDEAAESEINRMPEKFFTPESVGKVYDQCKRLVSTLDKLQRHFNIIKEKLYRARCVGLDEGIEAIQKNNSPFLQQHLSKINATSNDELQKAKELQQSRISSIELEHDTAVKAIWSAVYHEIDRIQERKKSELVEKMIKNECEFMQTQLRHASSRWKDLLKNGGPPVKFFNGIVINTGTEASVDEAVADLWKVVKASVRQKYFDKYLSPEAEAKMLSQENLAKEKFLQRLLSGEGINLLESPDKINDNERRTKARRMDEKKRIANGIIGRNRSEVLPEDDMQSGDEDDEES